MTSPADRAAAIDRLVGVARRFVDADRTDADRTAADRTAADVAALRDAADAVAAAADAAESDALTGLAARAAFVDRLTAALAAPDGESSAASVGLLLLDIDDFRGVNSVVGHDAGDRVLIEAASRLREVAPAGSVAGRLDGNEFALLLPATTADDAAAVGERTLARLATQYTVAGADPMRLSASAGLAVVDRGTATDDALGQAVLALQRAKSTGVGRLERFTTAMHVAARDRRVLAGDLRLAVDRSELRLVYQPIVGLDGSGPTGVEALMRWRHPQHGLISPAVFIPIVEEIGLAAEFGRWAIREACREIATIPGGLTVSVNVSGLHLDDDRFLDDVADVLDDTRLVPERLILEVTETALMRDARRARRVLGELRTLGVGVAIDDFGTGYSSLAYLQQLPLDVLKIDRSFVAEVTSTAGPSLTFARTIVALGQALGLRTVAEGIETPMQRDALAGVGCSHAQGYLFARPMPPADLIQWLTAQHAVAV